MAQRVEAEAIESGPLRLLIAWYRARMPADGWPPLRALRPETLPPLALPHIGRVDVELSPFRVYYRVLGSTICQSLGREVAHQYLDELDLPQVADVEQWYRTTLAAPGPVFVRSPQTVEGEAFVYEGVCLPLGTPADDPRAFLIGEDYLRNAAWRKAVRHRRYDPLQ